jgi:hypothetical protein
MIALSKTGHPASRAQLAQAPAVAATTGPWYQTIWSQPAIVGVPLVPVLLGAVALIAISSMLSAAKE